MDIQIIDRYITMDEKLENISTLNLVSYILLVLGDLIDKPIMMHIGVAGVAISFLFSLWICIQSRRLKDEKEKRRLARSIYSMIFCSFFIVYYIVKIQGN